MRKIDEKAALMCLSLPKAIKNPSGCNQTGMIQNPYSAPKPDRLNRRNYSGDTLSYIAWRRISSQANSSELHLVALGHVGCPTPWQVIGCRYCVITNLRRIKRMSPFVVSGFSGSDLYTHNANEIDAPVRELT